MKMFNFGISREKVEELKKEYPAGARIECVYCNDPRPIPDGTRGTVRHVDSIGTVHVDWDNGRSLGLVWGEDAFRRVED